MADTNEKKYLDLDGLKAYHEKISDEIEEVEDKIQTISVNEDTETLVII